MSKNPFIVTGRIEPKYFCDRATESARLVKSITNGNKMVTLFTQTLKSLSGKFGFDPMTAKWLFGN